jgi:hypothetical protein
MRKLFDALIRWNDTGEEHWVTMATYDTEGLPEDDGVFYCFDENMTAEQIEHELLFCGGNEFCVLDYKPFD